MWSGKYACIDWSIITHIYSVNLDLMTCLGAWFVRCRWSRPTSRKVTALCLCESRRFPAGKQDAALIQCSVVSTRSFLGCGQATLQTCSPGSWNFFDVFAKCVFISLAVWKRIVRIPSAPTPLNVKRRKLRLLKWIVSICFAARLHHGGLSGFNTFIGRRNINS